MTRTNERYYTEGDHWLVACHEAYMECALWSSSVMDADGQWTPADSEPTHPHFEDGFYTDLDDFLADPETAYLIGRLQLNAQQVGHDFWLTREGHGTGFWDRGNGAMGDRLADKAKVYGNGPGMSLHNGLVVHDDMSSVYFMEEAQ